MKLNLPNLDTFKVEANDRGVRKIYTAVTHTDVSTGTREEPKTVRTFGISAFGEGKGIVICYSEFVCNCDLAAFNEEVEKEINNKMEARRTEIIKTIGLTAIRGWFD